MPVTGYSSSIHTSHNPWLSGELVRSLLLALILALATSFDAVAAAAAPKKIHRHALVIGNKSYAGSPWTVLKSPQRDAEDMAALLRQAGFQLHGDQPQVNKSGRELKNILSSFGISIRDKRRDIQVRNQEQAEAIVAVVFYSGHGFSSGDTSYLAGVDAVGKNVEDVIQRSARLTQLVSDLTPEEGDVETLSLFLIDACRSALNLPSLSQASAKGTAMDRANIFGNITGFGRMVVSATTQGKVSLDGKTEDKNSVFTSALRRAAIDPAIPLNFKEYVDRVQKYTPEIAFQEYKTRQHVEVSTTAVPSDFFWTDQQGKDAAVKVAALNAQPKLPKNTTSAAEAWIYLGDLPQSATDWIGPRFDVSPKNSPLPSSLSQGTSIRLLGNMNAREGMPVLRKQCGKQKYQECEKYLGTLPQGLKVELLEIPQTSNPQKWARVRFDRSALYKIARFE